jgi:hypothetical protein
MDVSVTITVPFFGLTLLAEINGTYTHEAFEPMSVYLDTISDMPDSISQGDSRLAMFLPTPAGVSDFYSAHAEAIDEAVAAELADHAEAAADSYESMRQDEIDNEARPDCASGTYRGLNE